MPFRYQRAPGLAAKLPAEIIQWTRTGSIFRVVLAKQKIRNVLKHLHYSITVLDWPVPWRPRSGPYSSSGRVHLKASRL